MDATLTNEAEHRTYQLVFQPGEEAVEVLGRFADDEGVDLASFTAIGGFEDFELGFYNLETGGFDGIPFHDAQVEVLSLIGEITRNPDGSPRVHGHVVVGQRDGSAHGGHLLRGVVQPILIVALEELAEHHGIDHHLPPSPPPQQGATS